MAGPLPIMQCRETLLALSSKEYAITKVWVCSGDAVFCRITLYTCYHSIRCGLLSPMFRGLCVCLTQL